MNEDKEIKIPSFMVDVSLGENVNILNDAQAGKLFKMLFEYAEGKEIDESQISPIILVVFYSFKRVIDKGREKYINIVKRNRENCKNAGRPKNIQDDSN